MQLLIKNAKLRGRSDLTDISVDGGRIVAIDKAENAAADRVIDAAGSIVTEPMIDPHIHHDKVNVFEKVPKNESGNLFEAIEGWRDYKSKCPPSDIVERGSDIVDRAITNGILFSRSHADVDSYGGLKPIEGVLELKKKYKGLMDIQVVAFPQEGIVKDPQSEELLEEALKMGADVLGGMPANERCPDDSRTQVKKLFDLAEKYNVDVDMHVDESDDPFFRTLEMIADEAIARGYTGHRVTAGHTCALAAYDDHYARYVIEKVARAEMNIVTNPLSNLMLQGREDKQPIRRGITRVKELLAAGVNVTIGEDNLNDMFNPLGDANMLLTANILTHAAQMTLPRELEKVYDMITFGAAQVMGLKEYGIKVGNPANFVILHAPDTRTALRRIAECQYVVRNGKVVAETAVSHRLL